LSLRVKARPRGGSLCAQDYVRYLIKKRRIKSEDDLTYLPDLAQAVQLDWHERCQHGCRFATLLSHKSAEHGWGFVTLQLDNNGDLKGPIAGEIRSALAAMVASPDVLAVSILLPGVTDAKALIRILLQIQTELEWTLTVAADDASPDVKQPATRILLRYELGESVMSWALGFGPYEFLPYTRRAPITEIAFATKPKVFPQRSKLLNSDPLTAHLADVSVPVGSDAFHKMWEDTAQGKAQLLNNVDTQNAKAKVTFAVPSELWQAAHSRQRLQLVETPDDGAY